MPTDASTQPAGRRPRVSVIIPTYNAGPDLEELLDRLFRQTLPPHEVIVIDSSSSDDTAERAAAAGAKVVVIPQSEFDHGGTRNRAADLAAGDVLLFMTQDAMPADASLLEALTISLAEERTACAYARQIPKRDASPLERISRSFNYPDESAMKDRSDLPRMGLKTFFCSNVCAAVRRDVFQELGRFDAPVIFNEDLFFAAKAILAGYRVAYVAEARVEHSHNYTLAQQFRRFFDNGISMRSHDWIFDYAAVGREGSRLVGRQVRTLLREGKGYLLPRLLADNAAKLLGFQLGKRYRQLPAWLCARFSMHRRIWDKLHAMEQARRTRQSASGDGTTLEG